jgi:dTDP-4-dehydrorhamnose 3,5-epimerase
MIKDNVPFFLNGGISIDDRGILKYINDLQLNEYKRFYVVENHEKGFIRAWHGHLIEAKAFIPIKGSILVGAVPIDNEENPSKEARVERYVISEQKPGALIIPPRFANGFKTLSDNSIVLILSTSKLEDSLADDFRYPFDYWNPWEIEKR